MAIKGLSFGAKHEFISKDDPCKTVEEGATIFHWSAIPNDIICRIADTQNATQVNFDQGAQQTYINRTAFRNREAFRFGVKGWDNFKDNDDNLIPYKIDRIMEGGKSYEVVSADSLNQVPLNVLSEVGAHIYNENSMTDIQRKNFAGLLSQLENSKAGPALNATTTKKRKEGAKKLQGQQGLPPGAVLVKTP